MEQEQEEQKQQLCQQLHTIDTSLAFLALLILSVCLSWKGTAIQRQGLCDVIRGAGTQAPDVFPIRLTAGAIVVGSLSFFFGLALDTWEQTRCQGGVAERSAGWNLWASLFVLLAGMLRLYDLIYVRCHPDGVPAEPLPD